MKKITLFLISLASLLVFASCNSEENEDEQLLSGIIDGETWTFKYAKVFYNSIDNVYDIEMYGTVQTEGNPCNIIDTANPFISLIIPNQVGNYPLPFSIATRGVKFEQSGVSNEFFTATGGFVEITGLDGLRIAGYLSAIYDENNTVEGAFEMNVCN